MRQFSDLTMYMLEKSLNIPLLISIRRVKMEREGWFTDNYINWDHYTKVLQAKQEAILSTQERK